MKRPSTSGVMGKIEGDRNKVKDYFLTVPAQAENIK
jgi:hypothetical protein